MPLQLGEVVERIGPAEFAGVDQAHVQVADVGAVLRFVKQRILAVEDRLFQCPLADVIVQRRTGLLQEQRQFPPVLAAGS